MSIMPTSRDQAFLASLLKRFPEAANMTAQDAPVTDNTGLLVTGQQPSTQPREAAPVRFGLDNLDQIREAQEVERRLAEARKLPKDDPNRIEPHKGMFGMKGTLRDVLGTLGDAFLVQGGKNPIYRPQRQQERLSDAAAGFTQDPLGAAERLSAVPGGLDPAQEMQKQYENAELRRQNQESMNLTRESMVEKRSLENRAKGLELVSRMLSAGVPREVAVQFGSQYGLDEATIAQLGKGDAGMTVNQQRSLPLRERQVRASESNAAANMKRANRPPAGRSSPRTASQVDAEVLDAVAKGTATPLQQKYYDSRLARGGGRRSGRTSGGETKSGGKMVFRNGKLVPQ